ncbi:MAG: hypothetical protein ACE5JI_06240 [Acidobacteriota bacterium]
MSFTTRLHEKHRNEWQKMLAHPFLTETADDSVPDERFTNWLKQDYLFVGEAIPFLALMIPKGPPPHRKLLNEAISGLHQELHLFETMARDHGVDLRNVEPAPTNLGYINFLLASGAVDPYESSFTVLYTAEKAYLDSWVTVKEKQPRSSKWQAFIDNWTSDAFSQSVASLQTELDGLAEAASSELQSRMERRFVETLRYEFHFWELAYSGESW